MILADSSIWVDHLRRRDDALVALLEAGGIVCHPFVIGEIALGSIANRDRVIRALGELFQLPQATPQEVAALTDSGPLWGRGIGYVDAHLLASARLVSGARLWTRDRRLHEVAEELGIAATAG